MHFSPQLLALADYLSGEFDNRKQALDSPAWFVHLHLWQVPIPVFAEDSIALFAEQANVLNLEKPYRQRILRLRQSNDKTTKTTLQVQYYMPKDPAALAGGGLNPTRLESLTPEQLEFLPGCILDVSVQEITASRYHFSATPPQSACCCFTYQGNTIQVALGFEVTQEEFKSYDRGIDPTTGKATWGAILDAYRYTKRNRV
jgi:CpeT/CpcT family (DUF1001)